jgi:hypothetical protein
VSEPIFAVDDGIFVLCSSGFAHTHTYDSTNRWVSQAVNDNGWWLSGRHRDAQVDS